MNTIAFSTFGCRANSTDTDQLFFEAKRQGFKVVEDTEPADAYVINSCTVTDHADRDARVQAIRLKRLNPEAMVAVIGCYAQVSRDELLKSPGVDLIVGTAEKSRVVTVLKECLEKAHPPTRDQVGAPTGFLSTEFLGSRLARAPIKIQDGCNYRCSYCIIPAARGRSRSLPLETVKKQVEEASRQGFQEVVLTGIHLAHYGWDQNTDLVSLLRELLAIPGGPRIRLSTLDPFEISDELIGLFQSEKLCPHLHIALQSGSDTVLSRMHRLYRAAEFWEITQKLEQRVPGCFIGADVIVGFPGEGDAEFEETVDLLKKSYWSKLHVFSYSARKNTAAAALHSKVPARVIFDRSKQLRQLSEERYKAYLEAQVGTYRRIVLERPSHKNPSLWLGHTENFVPTCSNALGLSARTMIRARITKSDGVRVFSD